MRNFLTKMFDSKNSDIEAHLVMLFLAIVTLVALAAYHVVGLHNSFDPSSYGQGVGWILGGSGAAAVGQGVQRSKQAQAEGSDDK